MKKIIRFDQLQADVQAWGEILRDTLHIFTSSVEERKYKKTMDAILREIVRQLTKKLNELLELEMLLEKVRGPAFFAMIEGILTHWGEIQNVQGYVRAYSGSLSRKSELLHIML